ncbi:LacI family DNA-binding transcriptional regulator [Pararhodonellum marinum]|uniref:LacI family DNA-binding transcriptional regulator n=1 Tax=Pararhodonellum marinum TaxID=2755358 RepID=UPI00188DF140|nr:LacI family DNA-binding transcriptional regulator [Pararhodonellum marinum]
MKKGQVTITHIAKRLKVSVSTVSRALRDSPEIHPDTRKKIVAMAKEMNYQPNLVAQSLRNNKTRTLGIVVPELTSHFFASNISGIYDTAIKRGYNVMICQSNESYEQEKMNIRTLVGSRVDGLLISLSRETRSYEHFFELYEQEIPFVLFDRVSEEIPVSKVTVNDSNGAYNLTQHLLDQGARNIAFISGPEDLYISKKRKEGYLKALEDFGLPIKPELILVSDLTTECNKKIAKSLIERADRPDAIFAMIDPLAVDVMMVLKENGVKIPEEIALAGFTNNPTSEVVEPSLTTVSQPAYQIGKLAANHLLDQLEGLVSTDPQSFVLDTTLVIRRSSVKAK